MALCHECCHGCSTVTHESSHARAPNLAVKWPPNEYVPSIWFKYCLREIMRQGSQHVNNFSCHLLSMIDSLSILASKRNIPRLPPKPWSFQYLEKLGKQAAAPGTPPPQRVSLLQILWSPSASKWCTALALWVTLTAWHNRQRECCPTSKWNHRWIVTRYVLPLKSCVNTRVKNVIHSQGIFEQGPQVPLWWRCFEKSRHTFPFGSNKKGIECQNRCIMMYPRNQRPSK